MRGQKRFIIIVFIYWPTFPVGVWVPGLDLKLRLVFTDFPDTGVWRALLTRSPRALTLGSSLDSALLSSALFFLLTWKQSVVHKIRGVSYQLTSSLRVVWRAEACKVGIASTSMKCIRLGKKMELIFVFGKMYLLNWPLFMDKIYINPLKEQFSPSNTTDLMFVCFACSVYRRAHVRRQAFS